MSTWYLYLIECDDGSLYTGITTDVERRYAQHVAG
ncbi:MAG: GIY-YIG nuclease family protein, partial [Rhodocyclaceae bacterium]|nr:GIY-YIG nuclease family protein [Rhodocyclaceae bacterium]